MQPVKVFKPIKETTKPEVSQIIGEIPSWVSGRMIRHCPAKWEYLKHKLNHLFDGYMMICKFEVRGGKFGSVSFNSKFLQSQSFIKAEAAQKPITAEYSTRSAGSDDSKSIFGKVMSSVFPESTDNCPFVCRTDMCQNPLIIGDTGFVYELDTQSLKCLSRHDPVKEFGLHCIAAHPLTDEETGETYNVGISLFSGAKWKILKFPSGCNSMPLSESIKKGKIIATLPCRNKTSVPWFHSFGMSKNYIVWVDQPSYFNAAKAIGSMFSTSRGCCPREINDWKPEMKNRFYFFHKRSCKFVRTEILSKDAFFYYHVLNCYEDNDQLIVDVFATPNFEMVDTQLVAKLRAGERVKDKDSPQLTRYVIPLLVDDLIKNCPENKNLVQTTMTPTTATAIRIDGKIILEPEKLSDAYMDFCSWNRKYSGKHLRYIWSTGAYAPSYQQNKIMKFDIQTRELLVWEAGKNQHVGEPMFLGGNPEGNAQDDGVLVICVVNYFVESKGEKDFIVFLNAKDFVELGRAYFNAEIPIALHSVYVTDQ